MYALIFITFLALIFYFFKIKHSSGVKMNKIVFNSPVRNVVADNHGTINIDSFLSDNIKLIIDEVEKVKPKDTLSQKIKNETKSELAKLASGEISSLSKQTILWLKENITKFSPLAINIIRSFLNI